MRFMSNYTFISQQSGHEHARLTEKSSPALTGVLEGPHKGGRVKIDSTIRQFIETRPRQLISLSDIIAAVPGC
jgi:hypothetical protein